MNFDPIPRLQQIAATIRDSGADTFDAPATAAFYIECAIKEIERLRRDYSCICNEMRRMMDERDEVRQSYCSLMEAYRGGDGRVTANKLGWGYLFPRRPKKEDGK